MSDNIDVLVIDAASGADQFWREVLKPTPREIFRVERAATPEAASAALKQTPFDVIVIDADLCQLRGDFAKLRGEIPLIIVTSGDEERAGMLAMQLGAQDYFIREQLSPPIAARAIRYSIERRHAQNELFKAEEKFRSLFENTVEGIFQTTPKGAYIAANAALARIYGYESASELKARVSNIGQELYVERGRRDEFIKLMDQHDVVTNFESRIYRKDGTVIWISENVRAVRDNAGKLMHYEGTVEDITEKKRADEKVKNSEALYHSLVETLPQNIFRKDLNERFTFANRRFCQTLGRPLEEIVGKTDFDFFPAEMAAKYQKDDQLIMETGKSFEAVEENQPPGGEKLYVTVVKTPLYSASGEITARSSASREYFGISPRKDAPRKKSARPRSNSPKAAKNCAPKTSRWRKTSAWLAISRKR